MKPLLEMELSVFPKVLFVGNGVLRLGESMSWNDLLQRINTRHDYKYDLEKVPQAMKPECLCGFDVNEVQRRTAAEIKDSRPDESRCLKRLLSLPFDAILTTNYTYEIEQELSGKTWNENTRRKAFLALDGSAHVRNNTCICNLVTAENGRQIPVFHIHGEKSRKHSMILSYYSYANAVSRLISQNRNRGNIYQEKQMINEKLSCLSWLDYFLMGEVYSIGFGFDPSEFDIWWAVERKARENAKHGSLHAWLISEKDDNTAQEALFDAMNVEMHKYIVTDGVFLNAYEKALADIKRIIQV